LFSFIFQGDQQQAVTSLGHQEGWRVFWGAQIFWTMCNIFKLYPTHFSRGGGNFSKGGFAPWLRAGPD